MASLSFIAKLENAYVFHQGSDFPYAASDKIAGSRERLDGFSMNKRLREMIYFNNALRFI